MRQRSLWRQVIKNTFTHYSLLNFKHSGDPDDLVERKQKSIGDSISEQVIPPAEKFGVYMKLCEKFPHASSGTKKKWRRRIGL